MRKSSIHIEGGNISEFFHNDRSKPTKNSIFTMGNNYCNLSAQEALKLYKRELEKRTKLYTQRTGKKLHKNTKTLLSAIVNLDKHHTKKDVEKLVKWLEKELNTIVIQYSIHNDEGYIDESGQPHVNHHSHLMILGLDNEGRSVRKKLTRDFLRKLQTETAKILNMERGTDVKISRRKRLGTYEYKESMKIKNKEIFELKKELKQKDSEIQELKTSKKELEQKIKKLREQMKNFNASNENKEFTQQDYKALSEIKKMLKAKDLTEVKQKLENFKNEIKTRIQKRQIKLIKNNSEEKGILNKENVINTTKAIQIIKQTTKPNNENFLKILEENEKLKKENQELKQEISNLKEKLIKLKDIANSKIRYFKKLYETTRNEIAKYVKRETGKYSKIYEREKQIAQKIERETNINPQKKFKLDLDI